MTRREKHAHTDTDGGGYSCPLCAEIDLESRLAAALARIAAVEAQLAGVRALAARLRDYHGGFDQVEQERKHIAEVIDDALALQAGYLGPWLAASPTPTTE